MKNNALKCSCGGDLAVNNSYRAGPQARTSAARCKTCGHAATIVTFVAIEIPRVGEGAGAVANDIAGTPKRPASLRPALTPIVVVPLA
jgi:hypothetical protein